MQVPCEARFQTCFKMADVSANDIRELMDSLVFDEERDEIFDADDFEGVGEDELRLGEAVCSD